ncbi:hypothetical protein BH10PLA2_BH10PLA2_03030 [soil metagenome]
MSSSQASGSSAQERSTFFDRLESSPVQAAYGAFGVAAVFGIASIVLALKYHTDNLPTTLWAFLIGLSFLVAGVWRLVGESAWLPARDFVRLQVLILGGVLGSLTVIFLGLGLTYNWWDTLAGGWQVWQGKEGWRLWVVLLALVAGLAIMFLSLQFCRGDKQSSAIFRRLIYAYNAILSVWLLLLVLVVVNVLVYIPWGPLRWFNTTNYWAKSSMYGLSPKSENILEGINQPLKVYVLWPRNGEWYPELRVLMDNSRQFAKDMQVEYLSPDLEREKIARLNEEYKFGERQGLLLVYGKSGQTRNRFVKATDLVEASNDPMGRGRGGSFNGEKGFINEVYGLTEEKEKPVIYFTQGEGELELSDASPANQPDKGLGILKLRLENSNYQVKGLRFSPVAGAKSDNPNVVVTNEVPADAAVVVLAGPKETMLEPGITALNKYMNPVPGPTNQKQGKLIVLVDVALTPQKAMQVTGLEGFLTQFGVEVGNNVVLNLRRRPPELIGMYFNPDEVARDRNPILGAFYGMRVDGYKVRTLKAAPNPPPGSRYTQEPILLANPQAGIWAESNVGADFSSLVREYDRRGNLGDLLSQTPLTVGMAITESSGAPTPGNPHAAPQGNEKPRMIVVGDATWVSNLFMSEQLEAKNFDVFNSMLSWLRERPNNIGVDAKKRETFAFSPDVDISRMFWMPCILMVVGVIGLGAGVWVVRRR